MLVVTGGGEAVHQITDGGAEHRTLFLDTSSELNPRLWGSAAKLRDWIKREEWQVVHAQTRVTQGVSLAATLGLGVPRVTTCHGFFKTRILRKCFPWWGDRVIAISGAVERHLRIDWGIKPERIRLVRHGVEKRVEDEALPALRLQGRAELKVLDAITVVGALGRISPVKGYLILVDAMALLRDLPIELVLIGDGPAASELDARIRDLGLIGRIRRMASMPNHHVILHAFDIFCAPSLQEGLGLSILDAMARGTPVVASRVGGIPDLIRDESTGRLVPPGDAAALAGAIRSMALDPEGRIQTGLKAKRFVERTFTINDMMDGTESVYDELIRTKKI